MDKITPIREKETGMEPHASASKEEIQFKPLSDGLGFHPFANGLPYTPPAKTPRAERIPVGMGTGAEVAGKPVFAKPAPRSSVPSIPIPAPNPISMLEVDENFGFAYSFK